MHRTRATAAALRAPAVLALVAVLAACSHTGTLGAVALPPSTSSPPPTSTSAPPPTTAPPSPTIAWTGCPGHGGWSCGTLAVPLDHAHPGATITLALSRHPATDPSHRLGSLLLNPGGPGASGIAFAYQAVSAMLDPVLVSDFDVIGFDPRGVGASAPVECVDGPTLDRLNHLDPAPTTPAAVAASVAGAKELAAACEAHNGALLPHLSTVDAAEDMDDIRAALGDPKLTYLGFSYGTL
ncbi:MAG TPA: alpha/beta fold hydrolase, partial [Acidimicrobiales bacterium]